uniref:Tyrosine-protein phosphatase domain-containing protein n=1 Tax=Caenorhabditis tropicalis TaxID=1561998 RepID=A0A1I7URF3_9PELO
METEENKLMDSLIKDYEKVDIEGSSEDEDDRVRKKKPRISRFWGFVAICVIIGCVWGFGGSERRVKREALPTPSLLNETRIIDRLFKAIALQNSMFGYESPATVDTIIAEIIGRKELVPLDHILEVESILSGIRDTTFEPIPELSESLKPLIDWEPEDVSIPESIRESMRIQNEAMEALDFLTSDELKKIVKMKEEADKSEPSAEGKKIFEEGKEAAEKLLKALEFKDRETWCNGKIDEVLEIQTVLEARADYLALQEDSISNASQNLEASKETLLPLYDSIALERLQLSLDSLESMIPSNLVSELALLPEDLKNQWLMDVLNEGRSLEALEANLKYILHLSTHLAFIYQQTDLAGFQAIKQLLKEVIGMQIDSNPFPKLRDYVNSLKGLQRFKSESEMIYSQMSDAVGVVLSNKYLYCGYQQLSLDHASLVSIREGVKAIQEALNSGTLYGKSSSFQNVSAVVEYWTIRSNQIRDKFETFLVINDLKIKQAMRDLENLLKTSRTTVKSSSQGIQKEWKNLESIMTFFSSPRSVGNIESFSQLGKDLWALASSIQEAIKKPPERLGSFRELSEQVGYSRKILEGLYYFSTSDKIQKISAGSEPLNIMEAKVNPELAGSPAISMKELGEFYRLMDNASILLIPKLSRDLADPRTLEALDGLQYATLRKSDETVERMERADLVFAKFFGTLRPPFNWNLLTVIFALLTLGYLIPAGWFYRYKLYMDDYWPKPPPEEPGPSLIPLRPLNFNDEPFRQATGADERPQMEEESPPDYGHPIIPKSVEKIETDAEGNVFIWDEPPRSYYNKLPPEEESNLIWVPLADRKPRNLSYGSDDLRSLDTVSLSTQSDASDLMASTQSDYTLPGRSDSEYEFKGDVQEYAEFPEEAEFRGEEFWNEIRYAWALVNRMPLLGYRNQEQLYQKQIDATNVLEKVQEKCEADAGEVQKEEDLKAREEWEKWLEKDMAEVLRRRINQEEICRVQMLKQGLEERLIEEEKAQRSALENATKYVTESYVTDADEEITITKIAFESVLKIDNFIQSTHHDHWDHLFRCQSDRYTHDWARVRITRDDPDDLDFYDACYVYPWQELFFKVQGHFMNRLISSASPMFKSTVGVLWHWLFEHDVRFLIMLNQYVERGVQTSVQWYPEKVGEKMRVRRSKMREYVIECVEAKTKFDNSGVQRVFTVTRYVHGLESGSHRLKVLHMWDWLQDGQPDNWQYYARICDRMNRESLKNPVVVMSKHGCGRSMTLILSLIAAIMVRLDDDVSIHAMVHGARASKRLSVTSVYQVYFWRQVHYELLFRWFRPLRKYRVNMDERFSAWQDMTSKFKDELHDFECWFWWDAYENEMSRHKRMRFMTEYLRNMAECRDYELREERKLHIIHDAVPKGAPPKAYFNLEPVRRKPRREGDKPRTKKNHKILEFEDFSRRNQAYIEHVIEPLLPAEREFDGFYDWVKSSEEEKRLVNGSAVPKKWSWWYTNYEQKGNHRRRFF